MNSEEIVEKAIELLDQETGLHCSGVEIVEKLHREGIFFTSVTMSEADLNSLNDMRPDLLRQWLIEKMLENGAVHALGDDDTLIEWADKMEQYIKQGKKDDTDD